MNDELSIMFCFLIICYVDINFEIPPSNHEFIDISRQWDFAASSQSLLFLQCFHVCHGQDLGYDSLH